MFRGLALTLFFSISGLIANAKDQEPPARWNYGIGLGAIQYAQYPSSNQYWTLAVPAPTFQYLGKVLRADDRDGAHIYLYKGDDWNLELSGAGYPALSSSDNSARKGMADLPWLIALGPQLVKKFGNGYIFSLGLYQGVTTDFKMTRVSGNILDARISYEWSNPMGAWGFLTEDGKTFGRLTLAMKGGSREFHALYFEVPTENATADRPAYEAKGGVLSSEMNYYQNFKSGRASFYIGGSLASYQNSVNRQSPLHKSDINLSALIGINYILGESKNPGVNVEDTSGVINNIRRNRELRQFE